MVEHGPIAPISELDRREENCMKVDVIFPHKLGKSDVFRIEPPSLPLVRVVGRDTWISNWSIKLKHMRVKSDIHKQSHLLMWNVGAWIRDTYPDVW